MDNFEWAEELRECAVTVSDLERNVVYQNQRSIATFGNVAGRNLNDCHHLDSSRQKIGEMLCEGTTNAYTIDKKGVHKLIYQSPWYVEGRLCGLVEFSMVIPAEMPHFVR
ncbi:MAG: PAS sensor protein [Tidjanibacter sp.]|nr:PAS sensor protein [Tidjanibacter sp.]